MQDEKVIIGEENHEDIQGYLEQMRLYKENNDCTYYDLKGKRMIQMPMQEEFGIEVYGICSNKEVNMEILRSIIFLVLGTCLCLLLTMKVMSLVIQYITKPIVELTGAVAEIAKGNLDIQVQVESNDEIETLGNGINTMVIKQKEYIEKLLAYEKEKKNMNLKS